MMAAPDLLCSQLFRGPRVYPKIAKQDNCRGNDALRDGIAVGGEVGNLN